MPYRPKRPCNERGCKNLVQKGYCPVHRRSPTKRCDSKRPNAYRRGYTKRWARLRKMVLARDNHICVIHGCNNLATEVDHIRPKTAGGTDAPENLQSLCKSCHSKKTAKEDGGFGRV